MKNRVFLSIGSNIGNREYNIKVALRFLKEHLQIVNISSLYETQPVGYEKQPYFYNIVIEINTDKKPMELLDCIKGIEKRMGRKKTIKWGPRIIDIDILIYNDIIINYKRLCIPHKEIYNRYFILKALYELDKDLIIPGKDKNIKTYIDNNTCTFEIKKIKEKIIYEENM